MISIPLTPDYSCYVEEVTIDGTAYVLRVYYNWRGGYWALDIMDRNDTPIVSGIRLVGSAPLTDQFRYLGIPKGLLTMICFANPTSDPTRTELGTSYEMVYLTEDERGAL
jgi:hypothetical protein